MRPPTRRRPSARPRRRLVALLAILSLLALPFPKHLIQLVPSAEAAPSPNIVISQVYGAGGNSGANFRNDYIELFNHSSQPVSLNGWSVQYASAAGTSWAAMALSLATEPPSTTARVNAR